MDSLISAIHNFSITKNKSTFDDELNEIVFKFEKFDYHDSDYEWDIIKTNYSKIRYINELIECYEIPESNIFINKLTEFLENIDKMTQYYLKSISFMHEEDYIQTDCDRIKKLFEKSLNVNDIFKKFKIILEAYSIFVDVIKDFRNETFSDHINDLDFLENFGRIKKRRIN